MAAIFSDRFVLLASAAGAELYIRDAESLAAVRSDDIDRAGLPPDALSSLWRLGGALRLEFEDGPRLIFIDAKGRVRDTYRSQDEWLQIVARLREAVSHAA